MIENEPQWAELWEKKIEELQKKLSLLDKEKVLSTLKIIVNELSSHRKILICGNGGSAADAQHFAAELVVKFKHERKAIPAIALTTDTSILTACGNDFGFEEIFARQVEALGGEGDILIALSTSGNSENVVRAVKKAKEKGMITIALLGRDGGKMKGMCDYEIIVPANETSTIQEVHEFILHFWAEVIEECLK